MRKYKKVYIEITNICNLKCNFCPETKRQLKYMDKYSFSHIIQEIKPFTDYIYFHLMGEPLLNPELSNFLRICSENGLKVNITTNGTLLDRVRDILLNSAALRKVSISLHSFEANEQKVELQKYINGVMDFVKDASEKGIICELRLWNQDSEGIKASNNRNSDITRIIEEALQLDFSLLQVSEQKSNFKLRNNLYIHFAEKFEWPDVDRDIVGEEVFCYGLRDQFGILVDGTVVPCCLDNEGNIPLGNIFEQPLRDILDSHKAKKIYDGFTGRFAVEELCKKCGYAKRHKR